MKRKISSILLILVLVLSFSLLTAMLALAATAPTLGTAASFVILAGDDVSLTSSNVTGDVGLPLGFTYSQTTDSNIISGALHQGDATYTSANSSFYTAYNAIAASTNNGTLLTGATLPSTLTPGDYYSPAGCTASNPTLTLNAGGNPNAVWIFRIGTGGTGGLSATDFSVLMTNGGVPGNVFWWVKDAATMVRADFQGTILAGADISFTEGSSVVRALSKGAVTLVGPISTFSVPPAAPSPTVGGEAYPINKVNVLVPWLILALIIVTGGSVLVLRRRTSR